MKKSQTTVNHRKTLKTSKTNLVLKVVSFNPVYTILIALLYIITEVYLKRKRKPEKEENDPERKHVPEKEEKTYRKMNNYLKKKIKTHLKKNTYLILIPQLNSIPLYL